MGTVFAARHVGLDKPVVIKALHSTLASREESVLRFVREGRAASKIRHPHVVDVTDVGTHEGLPYLVMEHLEGEDLEVRLRSVGLMPPPEIARIMLPVLDAVACAHEQGVVHRDLKPSNIFLAKGTHGREIPKVLDFGIAKILDTPEVNQKTITRTAFFLGTPYYSSPEQAQSGKAADAKSDQYSLGAILYELATGKRAVEGKTPFEVLTAIVAGRTIPIRTVRPDLSPALVAIVERAMAHLPQDRYGSVRVLGAALLTLADPGTAAQWQPAFLIGAYDPTVEEGSRPRQPAVTGPMLDGPPNARANAFAETMASASMSEVAMPRAPSPMGASNVAPTQSGGIGALPVVSAVPAPPPSAPRRFPIALGALFAVLLVGASAFAVYFVLSRPPATVADLDVHPAIAAPVEPDAAEHFEIDAQPPTATFELDGVALDGSGHAAVDVPNDGHAHRLRVSAPGHGPQELAIGAGSVPPASVVLVADASPTVAPTPEVEAPDVVAPETPPETPLPVALEGTSDSPSSDSPRSDSPRSDSPRSDSPRSDSPRSDSPHRGRRNPIPTPPQPRAFGGSPTSRPVTYPSSGTPLGGRPSGRGTNGAMIIE
jgi:serine/threonine-protein kinase